MNCVVWNAWGLGSPEAFLKLRSYSPGLMFISETRVWGHQAKSLPGRAGFPNGFPVDSISRSGGLVLMWKAEWKVEIKSYSRRHIDAIITDPLRNVWRFTGVYGHPCSDQRIHT